MSVVKAIRAMVAGAVAILTALVGAQSYLGYGDIIEWLRRQPPVINNVIAGTVGVLAVWCAVSYMGEMGGHRHRQSWRQR